MFSRAVTAAVRATAPLKARAAASPAFLSAPRAVSRAFSAPAAPGAASEVRVLDVCCICEHFANYSLSYYLQITIRDAINSALDEELKRDPRVFIMGK
jgi:hypothetical protein